MARDKSRSRGRVRERNPRAALPVRPRLPVWKKFAFAALAFVGFFIALEILLAACGLRPLLHDRDPYVGFSSYIPLFQEEEGEDGQLYLTTAANKLPWFNEQRFPKEKPPGSYRIFSLGGSTTFGHPYDDTTSFSGWLRELLPVADPSRRWEVINAGGVSYASYRVAMLMEELVQYEPDLFIIYTGHNEFLEDRTYRQQKSLPSILQGIGSALSRTRTHALVDRLVHGQQPLSARRTGPNQTLLPSEVKTLLDSAVGLEAYHRDDGLRQRIFEHFELNLRRMIDIAHNVDAKVMLVTPASNLRDCSPFKSEHRGDLSPAERQKWRQFYEAAEAAVEQEQWPDVLSAVEQAIGIDDRYAHLYYLRGKAHWALGNADQAQRDFDRALEEDVCPVRAPKAIRDIVLRVANERDVPVVDFDNYLRQQAAGGLPGAEQFLDHVHPTIDAYRQLALLLLDQLISAQIVRPAKSWGEQAIEAVAQQVESSIDRTQHAAALRNLSKVLAWAGKHDEADRLALQAMELFSEDVETLHQAGNAYVRAGQFDRALQLYKRALEMQPSFAPSHYGAGVAYDEKGDVASAIGSYQRALQLDPHFVDAHFNVAVLYEQQSQFDQAEQHYRAVIREQPKESSGYNNLAIMLAKQGRSQEARQLFEEAIRVNPEFADAHANIGVLIEQQGDAESAIPYYEAALLLDPAHPAARENLQRLRTAPHSP